MAQITLYTTSKKKNSTAQPTSGYAMTGTFRTPFDLLNPVIVVEEPTGINLATAYNYAFVNNTDRYYWITKKTAISNTLWEMQLECDPLASWKSSIGSSNQYVVRAASDYNGEITDALYPILSGDDVINTDISSSIPWHIATPALSSGYYIVGIINDDTGAYGAVSYYLFPAASFDNLRHKLLQDTTWTNMQFTEIEQNLYKSLFNPMQYIVSVKWFPIPPYPTGLAHSTISIGWWPLTLDAGNYIYPMNTFFKQDSINLSSVKHTQSTLRGTFLNSAPYLQRTLYIEPFGSIDLDTSKMYTTTAYPIIDYKIDFITGQADIVVRSSSGGVIGGASAMMGVDISIAQSTQDIAGGAVSIARGVSSVVTGFTGKSLNPVSNIVSGVVGGVSGVANAAQSFAPNVAVNGTNGSMIAFCKTMYDMTTLKFVSNDDNTDRGRPLCDVRQISTLSGFVQVDDAQVGFSNCLAPERDAIKRFMEEGFFYE